MQHTRFGSSSHLSHPPTGFCVPYRRIGGAPGHTIPRWRSPSELGIVSPGPPRSLGMARRNPFSHGWEWSRKRVGQVSPLGGWE